MEPGTWFYFICVLSATVLWKDYNGTLEESLNNFEKKVGLYTYVDTQYIAQSRRAASL